MAKPECWSSAVSTPSGARARIYERSPAGKLYVSVWRPGSGEARRSLGHRDRRRAREEVGQLLEIRSVSSDDARSTSISLGVLFTRYVEEGRFLPDGSLKTEAYLQHIRQAGQWFARFFGAEHAIANLTPDRIREYIVWRRQGGVSGTPVGTNTVQRDLAMFKAALNWACQKYVAGQPLLHTHVMQHFKIPTEKDPRRPITNQLSITGLLAIAPVVHPFLTPLIILAWRSGRRLSSILSLRWDDVEFSEGTIRWRAEHDKIRRTQVVPAHSQVITMLRRLRTVSPGIGSAVIFPHPKQRRHPGLPVTRHLAAYWLNEAFRLAGLEKPLGSLWHMFRRLWATEKKHLPLKDVAAAGGWRDTATLLRYQQPDETTLRMVVEYSPAPRDYRTGSLTQ